MIRKPLSSFNPQLIALLLKAALEPVTLYAEDDRKPPKLHPKKGPAPPGATIVATRWHYCEFTSQKAAERFRSFIRLSLRLHLLRAAMQAENHPDTTRAYSVRISVDDRTGSFTCAPADATLDELLRDVMASPASPSGEASPLNDATTIDPLSKV